ncbi:hypothetical protein RV134_390157 [Roseovarius sp. EC-HK134]|uniref:hypothetical protein n=1 Tax=unclassified Roseovarius TaxID=2614913 RepID=UPI00125B2B9E|nr:MULTISPECIES: hypothetical protein [unclassified Roseovarius]VVT33570.1 hypothetical protein RV134_390157 [Roseovarius sp. EC-HK134]VVT33765.1 hypothetical protein RV420_470059 [Roseovarius sp. EC-SD190]
MAEVSLEDFVYETLMAISKAVSRAQDDSKEANAIPIALHSVGAKEVEKGEQLVSFSVSVQAEGKKGAKGGVNAKASMISVVTGKVSAEGHIEKANSRLHSIEFAVPMYFNSRWQKKDESKC